MGVLLGGFGKLQQGSYYRGIQAKLMNVQSRLRRTQRSVAHIQNSIERQSKLLTNQLNATYAMSKAALISQITASTVGQYQGVDMSTVDEATKSNMAKAQQDYSQMQAQGMAQLEQWKSAQEMMLTEQIENMKESQLEPLKDQEDSLQTEKDLLESQMQLAKADYEACKKMEQADMDMFKPTYTAGGQG